MAVSIIRPAASKSLTESWLTTAWPPDGGDLLADLGGGVLVPAALVPSVETDADVVDHHLGPLRRPGTGPPRGRSPSRRR